MNHHKQTHEKISIADAEDAARIAEIILSRVYQDAADRSFDDAISSTDTESDAVERYHSERDLALFHIAMLGEQIREELDKPYKKNPNPEQKYWDAQRKVGEDLAAGNDMGPFSDVLWSVRVGDGEHKRGVISLPEPDSALYLPDGEPNVVESNSRIVRMSRSLDDPFDFIDESLRFMQERRQKGPNMEGPENYATALKFFADKVLSQGVFDAPQSEQEKTERKANIAKARALVSKCLGNYLRISKSDPANIIELTNVMSAIKSLPKGVVEKQFSAGLVEQATVLMNEFNPKTTKVYLGAVSKMDVSQCGETAAMSVDLAIRKSSDMERSNDLLLALRAVENLPHTRASERAFQTVLDYNNTLEVAADFGSLYEMSVLLRNIVDGVTTDPYDTKRAKKMAGYIAKRGTEIARAAASSSGLTAEQKRGIRARAIIMAENATEI